MAELFRRIVTGYSFVFDEITDSRSKTYLFGAKPYRMFTILAIYFLFVFKLGPKWMKNRRPYNLKLVLMVYNISQVLMCGYLFIKSVKDAWGWKYKLFCEPVDTSDSESATTVLYLVYLYFLMKVADLLDTVFFVLRKKFNQITFLHVYHHAGMVVFTWSGFTYYPGGHGTMVGVVNCLVHVVMYSYYFMSVYEPEVRNWVWLKKFVTQLQIVQFCLCITHFGAITFITDCEYPRWTAMVFVPQNLFILVLFVDFYIKTYIRKPTSRKEREDTTNGRNKANGKYEGSNYAQTIIRSSLALNSELHSRAVVRS